MLSSTNADLLTTTLKLCTQPTSPDADQQLGMKSNSDYTPLLLFSAISSISIDPSILQRQTICCLWWLKKLKRKQKKNSSMFTDDFIAVLLLHISNVWLPQLPHHTFQLLLWSQPFAITVSKLSVQNEAVKHLWSMGVAPANICRCTNTFNEDSKHSKWKHNVNIFGAVFKFSCKDCCTQVQTVAVES